ncbi:MAG TPA: FecR domain-containing protein [Flavitalea sp.]|nr:FecR domain-containing protein [Flavitalea sp.]
MDKQTAIDLLQRYGTGNITPEEKSLVEQWYRQLTAEGDWNWAEGEKQALQEAMERYLLSQIDQPEEANIPVRRLPFFKRGWLRYAAAVLFIIGAAWIFLYRHSRQAEIVVSELPAKEITPGANTAVLTLADGSAIILDSVSSGMLSNEGNANLIKLDNGELVYKPRTEKNGEVLFNTLNVPFGSKVIFLTLSDGTKVWLNAGSSLRYPTVFTGEERKVDITGEAYFEVAKDEQIPFYVQKNDIRIQVFGTQFNVNAYENEAFTKVTLLEGSVQVSRGLLSSRLRPGQQAQVNRSGEIDVIKNADTEAAVAWKNGYFQLNGTGIEELMRQVARWYDVEVGYEGAPPARAFAGQLQRSLSLSEALRILEESNVRFTVEGRRVTVHP